MTGLNKLMSDLTNWLSDSENWPVLALAIWTVAATYLGDRSKSYAGICFGLLALKFATRLDFSLGERWGAMLFAYFGAVLLIDAARALPVAREAVPAAPSWWPQWMADRFHWMYPLFIVVCTLAFAVVLILMADSGHLAPH